MVMLTDAHQKLVEDNIRLTTLVIKRVRRRLPELSTRVDDRSIANLALMRAAIGYIPSRGTFSTYAVRIIRNALLAEYKSHCTYVSRFKAHGEAASVQHCDVIEDLHNTEEREFRLSQALRYLKVLPTGERTLIKRFYGLGCTKQTVQEIAKSTRQRKHTVTKRILGAEDQIRKAIAVSCRSDRMES